MAVLLVYEIKNILLIRIKELMLLNFKFFADNMIQEITF